MEYAVGGKPVTAKNNPLNLPRGVQLYLDIYTLQYTRHGMGTPVVVRKRSVVLWCSSPFRIRELLSSVGLFLMSLIIPDTVDWLSVCTVEQVYVGRTGCLLHEGRPFYFLVFVFYGRVI